MEGRLHHPRRAHSGVISRKPPSNGVSAAPKASVYEDVFGGDGGTAAKWSSTRSTAPPRPSDYAEIFGGGLAASCSIPMLDLPPVPANEGRDLFRSSSTLDYFDIFGGFDSGSFGVSYEDLFLGKQNEGLRKCSAANGRAPQETETYQGAGAVSGPSMKELKRDGITNQDKDQFSSDEGTVKLNGGTGKLNMAYHMATHRTIEAAGNGTIHDAEPFFVPGFTFVTDACPPITTETCNPSVLESRNLDFTAGLNVGAAGNNIRNIVPPANFSCKKRSGDDLHADQKQPNIKFTSSEDTSANEQYHSCSSSDQSTFDGDGSLPGQSTCDQRANTNISAQKIEEICSTSSIKSFKDDLRVDQQNSTMKSTAPEDVSSDQCLHSDSPINKPASTGTGDRTFPSQPANDCQENPDYSNGKAEKKISKKTGPSISMDGSAKIHGYDQKSDQKNVHPTSAPSDEMNGRHFMHSPSNQSASVSDRSFADARFLTVSDISLRTQPSEVPPPSRPPPKVVSGKGHPKMMMAANLNSYSDERGSRPATNDQKSNIMGASGTRSLKETTSRSSSPFFDVEVDASSAAAASVAAVKEAMELAQARLKSAKESMERKRDNFQGRKKLGINDGAKCKDRKEDETDQAGQVFTEDTIEEVSERYHSKRSDFACQQRKKTMGIDKVALDLEAKEKHVSLPEEPLRKMQDESRSVQTSYIQDDRAGEWKVEEQFFELVNNEKSKTVKDFSEHETSEKSKASVKIDEEKSESKSTKLANELTKNDIFLSVDQANELEFDGNKLDGPTMVAEMKDVEHASNAAPEDFAQEEDHKLNDALADHQSEENGAKSEGQGIDATKEEKRKSRKTEEAYIHEEMENNFNEEACNSENVSESESADKSKSFEVSSWDEMMAKEINSAGKCYESEDGERNLDLGSKSFEPHENGIEGEAPLVSQACQKQSEDGDLEEMTRASVDAHCHKENEPLSKEAKQDESKLTRPQEASHHTENERKIGEDRKGEENEKKGSEGGENLLFSGTEEESETREEICWQYFFEKIIRESQEGCRQSEEMQETTKVDELKNSENTEVDAERNHEMREIGRAMESEVASSSQEDCSRSNMAQEFCHGKQLEDVQQVSSQDRPSIPPKSAQELTESKDSDGTDKIFPEIIKTEEMMKEEREKELEKERVRKLEEEKERERERELEKERVRKQEEEREREREREKELEKERVRKLEEEREREREREKDGLAFERATREARDRAIAEARERAERAAVERATAEARQRALAEAREKAEKASTEALLAAEKASREARLRAERAAVERATAEARERAVERALAEKAAQEAKERAERSNTTSKDQLRKDKEESGLRHSTSFTDARESQRYSDSSKHASRPNEKFGGQEGESAIRCKARLERHQRTVERAAKALAEKNMRDILAQREQVERNRFAETLDADVRRWSNGKEGNLRALLSTLQYILGPESGWQPIPLTEVITAAAVKKAYRKATLCVHPDKLQQRGASIQQKYVCEKVFDLLKEAWNRFNSEER